MVIDLNPLDADAYIYRGHKYLFINLFLGYIFSELGRCEEAI